MGLKWEVTPSLPQEPHYFSGGSSQPMTKDLEKLNIDYWSIGSTDEEGNITMLTNYKSLKEMLQEYL